MKAIECDYGWKCIAVNLGKIRLEDITRSLKMD
jgi:hypothetical protein